jgi:archaellum biogenesis ATPase FlaH
VIARNQTPEETNALWGILLIFTLERVEQIRHEARASLGLVEEVIEARRETVRVVDELGHLRFEKPKYPEKLP